jgi:hypothetical protein
MPKRSNAVTGKRITLDSPMIIRPQRDPDEDVLPQSKRPRVVMANKVLPDHQRLLDASAGLSTGLNENAMRSALEEISKEMQDVFLPEAGSPKDEIPVSTIVE